jgi:hypothetical protein
MPGRNIEIKARLECERSTVRLLERCGIPPADRWSVAYADALTAGPAEPTMPDMVDVDSAPGPVPVPAAIAAPLAPWTAALQAAAGPAFVSLYVYGSALTSRYDPRTSDVNLLAVVEDLTLERLASLGGAVRTCTRQSKLRVTPLVLTMAQVRGSSDVFPLEFLDFTRRRSLLAGTDVLAAIVVGRGNLRHQCEYELRAKLVGLRQAFLLAGAESGVAHRLLVRSGGGLAAVLRYLLVLHGQEPPEAGEDIAREVGRVFAVDGEALAAPFTARRAERVPDETTARRSFAAHLRALEQLVAAVDALPVS